MEQEEQHMPESEAGSTDISIYIFQMYFWEITIQNDNAVKMLQQKWPTFDLENMVTVGYRDQWNCPYSCSGGSLQKSMLSPSI